MLYTSLFAASCAVGMCMATERLIANEPVTLFSSLHAVIFGSTLVVYNTHYLVKKSDEMVSDSYAWSRHYKLWHYIFLLVGLSLCCISLFNLSREVISLGIVLAFLSFAYSIPLLPFSDKKRLKDFGLIKVWILAGVWTMVTCVWPIVYWGKSVFDYPFEVLIRGVFLLALCIAFDIRDMQTDLESGIITLPNFIGVKRSYLITDIAIVVFVVFSLIQYTRYPSVARLSGEMITAVCTKLAISYTRKCPTDRAYLGLIDGMMMLYSVLMFLQ